LNPPGLIVERQSVVDGVVEVSGRLAGAFGHCPDCGTPSSSCHSRYLRTLSDLPISGAVVKLRLSVRRFRCKLRSCRRRTFSEALAPSLGRRHGRRVARCEGLLRAVGLALGGRPGSRMMARLAVPWSKDTLLRAVRREAAAVGTAPPATVIGIDDFAWRRGHSYGSIVVDLERRTVIDILPDRQRDTVMAWLKGEPAGSDHLPGSRTGLWRRGGGGSAPGPAGGGSLASIRERLRRFPVRGSLRTAPAAQGARPKRLSIQRP
jgi:transposase